MKNLLILLLVLLSGNLAAQNASFGIGIAPMNFQNSSGFYYSANVRTQFNNMLGWQTEVGYADLKTDFNFFLRGSNAMTMKTALTTKLISSGGMSLESIVGGGFFVDNIDVFGLLSGELFFSARIGKNLVAGIPLSYNFVTWKRVNYYTGGISLRFHM